jgi:glycerol-3-phosphate O-acyltransferase
MDPLSITTATVALLQAAATVSATLYDFTQTFRNADSRVSALCTQLQRLIKFLEAVDRTLKNCRGTFLLASRQSALSLEECKTTLDDLASLINRIKTVAKSASFFRRAKVAMDLTMFASDISGFEEKIHKSNWALQTMLSAIQV